MLHVFINLTCNIVVINRSFLSELRLNVYILAGLSEFACAELGGYLGKIK